MAARFDFANQNLKISQLKAAELSKTIAYERARARLLIVAIVASIVIGLLLVMGLVLITRSRNRERAAKMVLTETNRELEKAIAAKMEFLATTSHEIRTPLNGILGMTQVMMASRDMDEQSRERIGIVHTAGENMRMLVDDILDVAKMESGKLQVSAERFDLSMTLRQVAQVWRLQAESTGIQLCLELSECPHFIDGDGVRIRQIVSNLLSNAMKFTEAGTITLGARRDRARLHIIVKDSGIGIAPQWHESIFELFQQVDGGTTRKYGGTGLGLAICRNLVRAMGGDIKVDSEVGFGSTFTIDLPLIESDGAPIASATASGEQLRAALIVERNPLARGFLRAMLADKFDQLVFTGSSEEMLEASKTQNFEWIFADHATIEGKLLPTRDVRTVLFVDGPISTKFGDHVTVLSKPVSRAAINNALEACQAFADVA